MEDTTDSSSQSASGIKSLTQFPSKLTSQNFRQLLNVGVIFQLQRLTIIIVLRVHRFTGFHHRCTNDLHKPKTLSPYLATIINNRPKVILFIFITGIQQNVPADV
jgi:hypothetical protein